MLRIGTLADTVLSPGSRFAFEVDFLEARKLCVTHGVELWLQPGLRERIEGSDLAIQGKYTVFGRRFGVKCDEAVEDAHIHARFQGECDFPNLEIAFATAVSILGNHAGMTKKIIVSIHHAYLFYYGDEVLRLCWDTDAPRSWWIGVSKKDEQPWVLGTQVFAFGERAYHNRLVQ